MLYIKNKKQKLLYGSTPYHTSKFKMPTLENKGAQRFSCFDLLPISFKFDVYIFYGIRNVNSYLWFNGHTCYILYNLINFYI